MTIPNSCLTHVSVYSWHDSPNPCMEAYRAHAWGGVAPSKMALLLGVVTNALLAVGNAFTNMLKACRVPLYFSADLPERPAVFWELSKLCFKAFRDLHGAMEPLKEYEAYALLNYLLGHYSQVDLEHGTYHNGRINNELKIFDDLVKTSKAVNFLDYLKANIDKDRTQFGICHFLARLHTKYSGDATLEPLLRELLISSLKKFEKNKEQGIPTILVQNNDKWISEQYLEAIDTVIFDKDELGIRRFKPGFDKEFYEFVRTIQWWRPKDGQEDQEKRWKDTKLMARLAQCNADPKVAEYLKAACDYWNDRLTQKPVGDLETMARACNHEHLMSTVMQ